MPALLMHQNMRRFGGGTERRLNPYDGVTPPPGELPPTWPGGVCPVNDTFGFPAIAHALRQAADPAPLCAIGLTEMTNDQAALHATAALSWALTGGRRCDVFCFKCGITAGNTREYAMIVVPDWVRVLALGRVVADADGARGDAAAPADRPERWGALPAYASADWRFVVYAVLSTGGAPFAAAFLHNTATLESKSSTALRLPYIADEIRHNPVAAPQHVFIGGDFNVRPHDPDPRRPLYAHWAVTDASTPRIFGGTLGGTSWGGDLIDYWLSDLPPWTLGMEATLSTATWDGPRGLMSDHVAILLRIP